MSAFRTVFFRPRLSLDWRIPVAAVVRTPRGIEGLAAEVLPDPRCLGSVAAHAVMKRGIGTIIISRSWGELPISVGPHFELGRELGIPETRDPVAWVKHAALPVHRPVAGEKVVHSHQVSTIAWNHLKAWQVSPYVQKSLKPRKLAETRRIPDGVPAVTHYVEGKSTVLLMEPLAMDRESIRESVGSIFQRLSTYSHGWSTGEPNARTCSTIAYILPGIPYGHSLDEVMRQLALVATVVDTGDEVGRREFIRRVQSVGETHSQPPLSILD